MTGPQHGGPHQGGRVLGAWREVKGARVGALLLHGRGSSSENILELSSQINYSAYAYLAPQAAGGSWWPHSFLAPLEQNEPYVSSAIQAVGNVLEQFGAGGIAPSRVVIGGFSQGACLALEYVARHPQRYGGVLAFSGALLTLNHTGSLDGTPIFMGVDTQDGHIPLSRFQDSAEVLRGMNASVDARTYPDLGHGLNEDELNAARELMRQLIFDSLE